MSPDVLTLVIILGVLVIMFIAAGITAKVLVKKQKEKSNSSLAATGSDASAFADQLTERYRNER